MHLPEGQSRSVIQKGLLVIVLAVVLTALPVEGQTLPGNPDLAVLQPAFGQSYGEILNLLRGRSIASQIPGRELRFQAGRITVLYLFDQPERIARVRVTTEEKDGRTAPRFEGVDLEAAAPPLESRLYAARWLISPQPLDVSEHSDLLALLRGFYPAMDDSAEGRIILRGQDARAVLSVQRIGERRYLTSLDLVSEDLALARRRRIEALEKEIDRQVRAELRARERELKAPSAAGRR